MTDCIMIQSNTEHRAILQSMIRDLSQNLKTRSEKIAYELHENIAQSLAAVSTLLSILDKKLAIRQSEENANFPEINDLLKKTMQKVRSLAEEIDSYTYSFQGLEDDIRNLCDHTYIQKSPLVFFKSINFRLTPITLDLIKALCLYYFLEKLLEFTSQHKASVSIFLEYLHFQVAIDVHCYFDTLDLFDNKQFETNLIPILQEWLNFWGGSLQFDILPANTYVLTAIMETEPINE